MQRPPERAAWRTRTAAIWRSDNSFRVAVTILAILVMTLINLRM